MHRQAAAHSDTGIVYAAQTEIMSRQKTGTCASHVNRYNREECERVRDTYEREKERAPDVRGISDQYF